MKVTNDISFSFAPMRAYNPAVASSFSAVAIMYLKRVIHYGEDYL